MTHHSKTAFDTCKDNYCTDQGHVFSAI